MVSDLLTSTRPFLLSPFSFCDGLCLHTPCRRAPRSVNLDRVPGKPELKMPVTMSYLTTSRETQAMRWFSDIPEQMVLSELLFKLLQPVSVDVLPLPWTYNL